MSSDSKKSLGRGLQRILDTWSKAEIHSINGKGYVVPCPNCQCRRSSFVYRWVITSHFGLFDTDLSRMRFLYGKDFNSDSPKAQVQYFDVLTRLLSGRGYVDYRSCLDCGLVFQNYPHTGEHHDFFYRELYRAPYQWQLSPCDIQVYGRNDNRWVYQQYAIGRYFLNTTMLTRGASVLDVGCAEGQVCRFLELQGLLPFGIEPSRPMVNYARRVLGLNNIICGSYSADSFPESYFDGIVSHHVIEHAVRIHDFSLALSQHLKPGGFLLLQCPCIDNLTSAKEFGLIMSGGHVYAFSETFLTRLLVQHGFEILEVRRSPLDLSSLEPVERGQWNTTAWADDPGGISLLCCNNKTVSIGTASLSRLAAIEHRSGRPTLC